MKITYLASSPIPSPKADSVHVMKMCSAWANQGHDITLLTPIKKASLSLQKEETYLYYGVENNFYLHKLWAVPVPFLRYLYSFISLTYILLNRPDIIYGRDLLVSWMAAELGFPVAFEVHDSLQHKRNILKFMFRRLINSRRFVGLFSITQALKDHYIESFSVPAEKVFVVPDGADPISTKSSFAPFQKIPGQIDVGYVGSLYRGRGIELIIKLASALPMFFFHVVGGNEEDVAIWSSDVKGLSNIRFYGYVPHAETAAYLLHCDVLIAPYQKKIYTGGGSHTEQWASPLKVFEYMSSGRPFICSDIPVFREVLRDRENCFLCAPEDVSAWIAALDFIVNNPHEAALIAAKAKDEFLSQYTWAIRAKNMAGIIINSVDHSKA